jgi:putative DNA primase/helicase
MRSQALELRAADIHNRVDWPSLLVQLGIDPSFVRLKKQGPCPVCNGSDRYVFDNRTGRGDFLCRQCGAGDGFKLLMNVHRWSFSETRKRVLEAAGLVGAGITHAVTSRDVIGAEVSTTPPSVATSSIRALVASSCAVLDCQDAVLYLTHRGLWPLPEGCQLRAHVGLDYWHEGRSVGRFSGLVGPVLDIDSELVTAHVTYLADGKKLTSHEPRKILSKMTGREGCAVRLSAATEILGIAEGIETALSAAALDGIPVWAALNTALLAKFDPPAGVRTLRIYADRDAPGLLAAGQLMERLQGRLRFELCVPSSPHKDFNDQLRARENCHESIA